jgi:broad specificity phosphatase PhoE
MYVKEIIIIRHGEKDGDQLTPSGILACQSLAKHIGSLDLVFASERNRAIQTAELVSGLSVSVDQRANTPSFPDGEINKLAEVQKTHPLGIIGAIWQDSTLIEDAWDAGIRMQSMVDEIMNKMNDGERALIVSHDGTMIGLEKVLRNEPFDSVDHSFNALEGFSVSQDLTVKPFKI